jgi:GLPGLI family protein
MKHIHLIAFFLFLSVSAISQKSQALEYEYTDVNGFTCQSFLIIKENESLFYIEDNRKDGNNFNDKGEKYKFYNDRWSRIFYKNNSELITRIPIYGKEFVYQNNKIDTKIELGNKTKTINKFKCQDAKVSKGGKTYLIWFTTDILIKSGPLNIHSLPGLVVEMSEISNPNLKIKFLGITDKIDNEKFNSYKKYILNRKKITYETYEIEAIKLLTNIKRQNFLILAQHGATIEYAEDQSYFTKHLVDIPKNLASELQKIKQ